MASQSDELLSPEPMDPLMRVTSLRDVARESGVSVSTASRVLSGSSHPVSEATRGRGLGGGEDHRFQPNPLPPALATARSQTIGVLVHDVSDPYFAEIVRGLEDVAGQRDHALFVASSDRDPVKEVGLLRAFASHRVDCIVLVASGLVMPGYHREVASVLRRFESQGGVVVVMSEHFYPGPRVGYDNPGAVRKLVRHLVDLGHRSIGYLSGPPDLAVSAARQDGYVAGLAQAEIDFEPGLVECGWFSMEGGVAATARLLERFHPSAIVAANDLMAFGALRFLRQKGYDVPGDLSVAGMDDIEFAEYATVPLTTVRVSLTEFGRQGAKMVFDLLDGHQVASDTLLETELVVRGSTGARRSAPVRATGTSP